MSQHNRTRISESAKPKSLLQGPSPTSAFHQEVTRNDIQTPSITSPFRPHIGESDLQKLNFNVPFSLRSGNQNAGTEELVPCIDGYRLIDHGRVEFHVRWKEDSTNDEWLQEGEMNVRFHSNTLFDIISLCSENWSMASFTNIGTLSLGFTTITTTMTVSFIGNFQN